MPWKIIGIAAGVFVAGRVLETAAANQGVDWLAWVPRKRVSGPAAASTSPEATAASPALRAA